MPAALRKTSCACISLRRASRAVVHLYDQVLTPANLKASQFMILHAIAESGEIAHCDLAREFAASIETLSRRLSSARQAGLVEMRTGEMRKRMYRLTPAGAAALKKALPYWRIAQYRLQQMLGPKDWEQLTEFLDRISVAAILAEELPVAGSIAGRVERWMPDTADEAAQSLL